MAARRPVLGVALGSGSARGWAHIGVLRELNACGLQPDVISGSSVGAIVGAMYAMGRLGVFERWIRQLGRREIMGLLDFSVHAGGFVEGERLKRRFVHAFGDVTFDDLDLPLGVVATALHSGRERWLRDGSVVNAIRASIALPGLMGAVRENGEWLVDGGLVNPVPVSLCHAMGADVVIAVDLNGDLIGRHGHPQGEHGGPLGDTGWVDRLSAGIREKTAGVLPGFLGWNPTPPAPGMFETMATAINIMQDRITRSRLAGDPADIVIRPRLAHIGLMEFDRGREAIVEGARAVRRMGPALEDITPGSGSSATAAPQESNRHVAG